MNKEANGNNDLFRIECERKLRILDEEGITDDHSGSADRTFLIAQKKQLEEDLLSCEKDVREFTENKSKFYGRFNERQKRFIEQINTIQNNIFLYQSNMAELELNRKSAECALKIFNKLQISANTEMDLIITEIKKRLDTIFPDGRILELESLEHDKIYLTDMGSTKRQINHLSKGTRDCFAFAAKLAFLARTPNDTKMLFLDEPFLSMDQTRMESAVRLLKNHQKETENRIIVFTKDNSLVKALKKTFQNATIHELTT